MTPYYHFSPNVDRLLELALSEDLAGGDLTSDALIGPTEMATARAISKQPLIVAGLGPFARVFERVDSDCHVELLVADGDAVISKVVLAHIHGPARSILRAERTALNFLQHLSGVATLTARFVAEAGTSGLRICDTRKTTPGFRELEKYAVRMGGGKNHRFNLGSAVMIKDNHIAAIGSITEAVNRARQSAPHTATIEVEVTSFEELDEALAAGVDIVMLDNMSEEQMRQATARCKSKGKGKKVLVEASGSVTLDRIAALRDIGVDIVSSGALTHSAPSADISLNFQRI